MEHLNPVSFDKVDITGGFWADKQKLNRDVTIRAVRDRFADTLMGLHFNEELQLVMDSKSSHVSMRKDMTEDAVMQAAIGQGETLMSPLHLNMITASVANNGDMMVPYMIESVVTGDGKVLKEYEPQLLGNVMSESEAAVMRSLMEAVVDYGTAKRLSALNVTVAGKTGSAEFSSNKTQSHAWFTGYAPAEDPQIAVTVIVENAGSGGEVAAPIAGDVFSAYFSR